MFQAVVQTYPQRSAFLLLIYMHYRQLIRRRINLSNALAILLRCVLDYNLNVKLNIKCDGE